MALDPNELGLTWEDLMLHWLTLAVNRHYDGPTQRALNNALDDFADYRGGMLSAEATNHTLSSARFSNARPSLSLLDAFRTYLQLLEAMTPYGDVAIISQLRRYVVNHGTAFCKERDDTALLERLTQLGC